MTRLVPTKNEAHQRVVPPLAGLGSYIPITDHGLVLSDASGVIASWSITGGVLTVTTNAVSGPAFLLRPITPFPSNALHHCHVTSKRNGPPPTTRVSVTWGVGGDPVATSAEWASTGIGFEPDASEDAAYLRRGTANNSSGPIDATKGAKGIISSGSPNGNDVTGSSTIVAGGQRLGSDEASAYHRADGANIYGLAVEGIFILNETATAQTFSIELAYRYEFISYEDGAITQPPPVVPAAGLNPIGPLTASLGWVLTDPSGIIASAPVSDGATITIGLNAVDGVALLTRPLTSLDQTQFTLATHKLDAGSYPIPSSGSLMRVMYGFSGPTGNSCVAGMTLTNSTGNDRIAASTNINATISGASNTSVPRSCHGVVAVTNLNLLMTGVPHTAMASIQGTSSTARGAAQDTAAVTSHECLFISHESNAGALELVFDLVASITQPTGPYTTP